MAWWDGPDPYRYERIGIHWTGRPVYVVSLDGVEIGVIEPYRASTDTKIPGTRMSRSGQGRDEFVAYGEYLSHPRRRDVADRLQQQPTPPHLIAHARNRYAKKDSSHAD